MPTDAKTWILTGDLTNFRINVERGFDPIGFKERRRIQASEFEPGDEVVFYVTGVQVPTAKVVGRLKTVGAPERFGAVLPKGSKLTACVNKALDRLWLNGTIKRLQQTWLPSANRAPVLK